MSKLKKLRDRQAAIAKAMRELSDKAGAEDRPFSEDEQKAYDALKAELDDIKVAVAREEELLEIERGMIPAEPDEPDATGATPASNPNPQPTAQKGWKTLGEFLAAVVQAAGKPSDQWDERLRGRPGAISGLGESVSSEGGFLVQKDFVQELLRRAYGNSQVLGGGANYAGPRRIPLSGNSNGVKINAVNETSRADGSRWGGVQAYWLNEGGTATATKPDFRQIELSLKKLIGLCYATDELLADTAALEAVISEAFAEEFAFKIQDALINGTGAGQPLGILNAPCLVSVAKESGQTATTIVKANIDKMYSRMWPRGYANSVWLINQDCYPQLFALADAGSNAVYLPAGGMSAQPYDTLMGRPLIPIEQCQTLGTAGDIYFCDWTQYLYCDKGTMDAASSIHVKFTTDEMTFRFVYRADGQPAWNSALTPFKGSNTVGPFINLATRS